MKFSLKNIAIIVVTMLSAAGVYFVKEYHRKPADVTSMEPVANINADSIVVQFEKDESKANKQYLGKAVQVVGAIAEIINQQDTLVNVLIGDKNSLHKVSCVLDQRHTQTIKKYFAGEPITIKGICTGFLLDVELNRCTIVDDNKE
jgi:hypothetical protein